MNIFQDLVLHFKTQTRTAERLGVDQGTVSGWVRGKHGMSAVIALRAEAETDGIFKAIELCPNLKKAISPNCAASEAFRNAS